MRIYGNDFLDGNAMTIMMTTVTILTDISGVVGRVWAEEQPVLSLNMFTTPLFTNYHLLVQCFDILY